MTGRLAMVARGKRCLTLSSHAYSQQKRMPCNGSDTFFKGLIGLLSILIANRWATGADPVAWLPSDLNAVARVKVADVYKSPLARKEGWIKKAAESFIQHESFIPPGTSQILIGAQLDLTENLASHRQCAVLVPEANLTLEKLSPWLPDGLQSISGKQGAQFGDGGYVVDTGDGCWLSTMQSSRQTIARWLKTGPAKGGSRLTSYLSQALASAKSSDQVVLAIDLQDNFDRRDLSVTLKETDWFPNDVKLNDVADVLSSVTGITIAIAVDETRSGTVALDFARETSALKPFLEKIVDAVLVKVGASSDDFVEWKWNTSGSRVNGSGPVSPNGARRLLSILDPPSVTHAISASTEEPPATENKMGKSSQKYCKSVRVLLDDLQKNLKQTRDNHALWFERYARKIDDLPRLNVDGELLDYSAKVSNSLRYQGQAQRMSLVRAGTRTQQSGANYAAASGYISPYGSQVWVKPLDTQAGGTIRAEENQAAVSVRFSEWKQIEDGFVEIRNKLTAKYQLEF